MTKLAALFSAQLAIGHVFSSGLGPQFWSDCLKQTFYKFLITFLTAAIHLSYQEGN